MKVLAGNPRKVITLALLLNLSLFTPHLVRSRHLWWGWMVQLINFSPKPRPLGRGAGFTLSFAQTSASRIFRAQEILEEAQALIKRLREPKNTFIKAIIVNGVTLLSKDEIGKITSLFVLHWLSEKDFRQIEDLLRQAYRDKGYVEQPVEISHRIQKQSLIIQVKE